MNIVFRVDASIQMGTGHVMRCLTLANALKEKNNQSYFICRQHQGHLTELIEGNGHKVLVLPAPYKTWIPSSGNKLLPHAKWLGIDMLDDAEQSLKVLDAENIQAIDYLVIDHYALDMRWENKLKPYAKNIMVIDDLADRQHNCELLLDQTFGRSEKDYKKLAPQECTILTGSQYALLRPEFARWREYSLKRRTKPEFKKLLIAMGGVDPDNYTGKILQGLNLCKLPKDLVITVVLGKTAPYLNRVKELAMSLPLSINVEVGVDNMAEIMANSDIAIGAAGTTTWERCCLGLPSLIFAWAENQKMCGVNLEKQGGGILFNDIKNDLEKKIILITKVEKLKEISEKCRLLCDGQGIKKVLKGILK